MHKGLNRFINSSDGKSSTLVNQGILSSAQSIVRYSICSIDNSTPARYWPRVVQKGDEYPLALSSEV